MESGPNGPASTGRARPRWVLPAACLAAVLIVGSPVAARVLALHGRVGPEPHAVPDDAVSLRLQLREADGLYLVPIGPVDRGLLATVGARVEARYGVRAIVLPRLPVIRGAVVHRRRQLEGDRLIDELFVAYPTADPRAAIIGVTPYDIFWSRAASDRFAFGVASADRYAVISVARMDPLAYEGGSPSPRRVRERLERMVARYVGVLHFRLARASSDRRSALRRSIRSLADLDEMTPAFCPARPHAVAVC